MIDLRVKGLPNSILLDGKPFFLKTDFREWLKFGELLEKPRPYSEYFYLFDGEIPNMEFINELIAFYSNKNSTPNSSGGSSAKLLDWIEDGEYIVGSFLAQYGIDLVEVEYLHWHKFQALFRSLPDSSKIMEIMGYRAYKKSNISHESQLQKQRDMWGLHSKEDYEIQLNLLEEFNKL